MEVKGLGECIENDNLTWYRKNTDGKVVKALDMNSEDLTFGIIYHYVSVGRYIYFELNDAYGVAEVTGRKTRPQLIDGEVVRTRRGAVEGGDEEVRFRAR